MMASTQVQNNYNTKSLYRTTTFVEPISLAVKINETFLFTSGLPKLQKNSTYKNSILKFFTKFTRKLEACNLIKNDTLAQVFSHEFCEIFKSTCFVEHMRMVTYGYHIKQVTHSCSITNGALRTFTKFIGKHLYWSNFLKKSSRLKGSNCIKKCTQGQGFSVEFCEIFKSTYFVEHRRTATIDSNFDNCL